MNSSLIKNATKGKFEKKDEIVEVVVSKIKPNPHQPRKNFNDESIRELADTIKKDGLLQPIVVTKRDNGYIVVAGERRYRASLLNNANTIKASVIDITDDKMQELALLENIQREDLTDFETAEAIDALWDSGNYATKQELAQTLGKTPQYVSKSLAVLKISEDTKETIRESKDNVSTSVMLEIAKVDKDKQSEVLEDYKDGKVKRDDIAEMTKSKEHIKVKFKKVIQVNNKDDLLNDLELVELDEDKKYTITIEEK